MAEMEIEPLTWKDLNFSQEPRCPKCRSSVTIGEMNSVVGRDLTRAAMTCDGCDWSGTAEAGLMAACSACQHSPTLSWREMRDNRVVFDSRLCLNPGCGRLTETQELSPG